MSDLNMVPTRPRIRPAHTGRRPHDARTGPRALAAVLAGCLLWIAGPATVAGADDAPPSPPQTYVDRLGRPARLDRVRETVSEALGEDVGAQSELADALGTAGGAAAVTGLEALLESRHPEVRARAFLAVGRIGLRSARVAEQARWSLTSISERERLTALDALGTVGDGRDMRTLLDAAGAGEGLARRTAFRALRRLTGADIPYDVARWESYWSKLARRADVEVARAIADVEGAQDAQSARIHVRVLGHLGWIQLERVQRALDRWFMEPSPNLRMAACLVSADLSLAARVVQIADTARFSGTDREVATCAERALQSFGFVVTGD